MSHHGDVLHCTLVATLTVLPGACPACGFVFGLADVATQQAHFLGHILVYFASLSVLKIEGARNPSLDW